MQNALRDPKNDLSPTGLSCDEQISIIGSDSKENGETLSATELLKKQIEENYYDEMLHFLPSLVDVSAIPSPIVSIIKNKLFSNRFKLNDRRLKRYTLNIN